MTRNQNRVDASSSSNVSKTCDNNDVRPWSELKHDLLLLVMMQLGVVDFVSFSGVCKSWRSFANPNRNRFMASKPPMLMCISPCDINDMECCLEDCEGRKFKTIIPHSAGRSFVGLTCGFLILFRRETRDFWLVNPITRDQLYFPPVPDSCTLYPMAWITGVLVFSPLLSKLVFVMLNVAEKRILFSIAGMGAWNLVSSPFRVEKLYVFKKKMYTICFNADSQKVKHIRELTLNPEPQLTLLETKNSMNQKFM